MQEKGLPFNEKTVNEIYDSQKQRISKTRVNRKGWERGE